MRASTSPPMPRPFPFIPPCLATLRPKPPGGNRYLHEVKLDGHRLQIHKVGAVVRLFARNGHECTGRFGFVAGAVVRLSRRDVVIDGKLVCSDRSRRPDFYDLTFRRYAPEDLKVWAFDLLSLNGMDLRAFPLVSGGGSLRRCCGCLGIRVSVL